MSSQPHLPCKVLPLPLRLSIYAVHDEVKDKDFELELSWVGEGWHTHAQTPRCPSLPTATEGVHQMVPEDVKGKAIEYAKESLKESDSEDELDQDEAT